MYGHYRQGVNSVSIVGRSSTLQCPLSEVPLYLYRHIPHPVPYCISYPFSNPCLTIARGQMTVVNTKSQNFVSNCLTYESGMMSRRKDRKKNANCNHCRKEEMEKE